MVVPRTETFAPGIVPSDSEDTFPLIVLCWALAIPIAKTKRKSKTKHLLPEEEKVINFPIIKLLRLVEDSKYV
jgi:hypothetical protein